MRLFYAAIAFLAAVAIAEIVVSARWTRGYFTFGLPIFIRRIERPLGLADVSLEALQKSAATVAATPLLFRRLDANLIAFREKAFGGSLHYFPLMRGAIRHRDGEPSVRVVGLMNWTFVALLLVCVAWARTDFGIMAPYLALAFGVLYLIQAVRYNRVAKALR